MDRSVAVAVTLAVAVVLATVPAGGLAQSGTASVAPGERFAGVVGVQGAEVEGEVATRAFRVRFARADSDAARAAVVADDVADIRARIAELERREDRLRAARANGSISEGQYRARVARLVAESRTLQRRLNRTADASRQVPDPALRERGVTPDELDRLRRAAGNLTGPEVAAIARDLAGDGRGPVPGGPPGRSAGNGTDRGPPDRADGGPDSGDGAPADDPDRRGNRSDGSGANRTAEGDSAGTGNGGGDGDGAGSDNTDSDGDGAGRNGGGSDTGSGSGDGNAPDGSGGDGDGSDGPPANRSGS